uniref:Putative secreted protein n=1 Tax=Ixodes ricinus TaxID=34613 RepID=A0A6B0UIQ9_IXORI
MALTCVPLIWLLCLCWHHSTCGGLAAPHHRRHTPQAACADRSTCVEAPGPSPDAPVQMIVHLGSLKPGRPHRQGQHYTTQLQRSSHSLLPLASGALVHSTGVLECIQC